MKALMTTTALALSLGFTPLANAMPMGGSFTGQITAQTPQPLGPNRLKITETAAGTNSGPGTPLDGAQIQISEIVMLSNGKGPVNGTIVFSTPTGTTTSPYKGVVKMDAQGRVTAAGKFRTTGGTGAFAGLKGTGSFSVAYSSKTDFTGQWTGNFKAPAPLAH